MDDAVLAPYKLNLKNQLSSTRLECDSILDDGSTLIEHFRTWYKQLIAEIPNDFEPRANDKGEIVPGAVMLKYPSTQINEVYQSDATFISGLVTVGRYGERSQIKKPEETKYFQKETKHIEEKPFFFVLCVPTGKFDSFLLTQKISVHSIFGHFWHGPAGFFPYWQNQFRNGRMVSNQLTAKPYFDPDFFEEACTEGILSKITFEKHTNHRLEEDQLRDTPTQLKLIELIR